MHQQVELIGRIGQDPVTRNTNDGSTVATISVATSEAIGKGEARKEHTEWHRCVFWGKTAETVGKHCKKGQLVHVVGVLRTREWVDKDGNKRQTTEINGRKINFLSWPEGGTRNNQPSTASTHGPQSAGGIDDDDIPF